MYKVGDYVFRELNDAVFYANNYADTTGIIIAVEKTDVLPVDTVLR